MRKAVFLLIMILGTVLSGAAQYRVIVDPKVSGIGGKESTMLYESTIKTLEKIGYIDILSPNSEGIEEADYKIRLRLNDIIRNTHLKPDKDDPKYDYDVSITVAIDRLSNNTVLASKSFTHGGTSHETYNDAMETAFSAFEKKFKNFILTSISYHGQVLEISKVKDNQALELYISIGSIVGIKKGQKLDVKLKTTIAGRSILKSLGKIKVEEIEGAEGARCKVTDGKDEIYKAYMEDPENLVVSTTK